MTTEAICASCGKTMEANTVEQEAASAVEFESLYGLGKLEDNDCVVVCDDCFQEFYSWAETQDDVLKGVD